MYSFSHRTRTSTDERGRSVYLPCAAAPSASHRTRTSADERRRSIYLCAIRESSDADERGRAPTECVCSVCSCAIRESSDADEHSCWYHPFTPSPCHLVIALASRSIIAMLRVGYLDM